MWPDGRGDEDDVDQCDGYVVLIADAATGELDCYGPFSDLVGAAAHFMTPAKTSAGRSSTASSSSSCGGTGDDP